MEALPVPNVKPVTMLSPAPSPSVRPASPLRPRASKTTRPAAPAPRFEGLDGLRAAAVLAVLVFHLHPGWLPGGFLGVDLFFVISGFLITSLLLHEVRTTGRLDLRGFYLRRARRLLPALVTVVFASSLIARLVDSDLVVGLGRQVLGAATFSTNWVEIAAGQSYFDRTAPALFMNFWSLAVEEQFYLLWPVCAYLLIRLVMPKTRVWAALGIAGVSTLAMAVLVHPGQDATRVYYGTDTHLMGLMLGAALAFAWASPMRVRLEELHEAWGRWALPSAVVVLAGLMLFLSDATSFTYRGGILLACLAACLLLIGSVDRIENHRTVLQRVLDAPAMVWLGTRSYGIYLWHWPVILVVGQLLPAAVGTLGYLTTRLLCVALTLGVAEASYRWIELPIRRRGFRAVGQAWLGGLLRLPRKARLATSGMIGLLVLAFALTVITAPAQSKTAADLRANAAAASSGAATGEQAVKTGVLPLSEAQRNKGFTMPTGKEIDGFGDSMMVGAVHAIEYYLPGTRVDAKSNRRWSDGLAAVRERGSGMRRAVVLDFGTNAGMDEKSMTKILDALGPDRMVVMVNEYGNFSRVPKDNETLERVAAGRPNVIIADWAATVRQHPDALQSDGIHPSLRGSHYYAATVRAALAELSQRHTGTKVALEELPMP